MKALVLSGGGAKGAYEIGVMLALKKLHIKYNIVTGASVGALNGLFAVQKDIKAALKVWRNIEFSKVYEENLFTNNNDFEVYKQYAKSIINDGGLNPSGLKTLIDDNFNSHKYNKSDIDFGIVTFNLTKRKGEFKLKKDMNEVMVKDYVLASATCYPAFKPKKIENNYYIDGGYADNLPIDLAISMGAKEIIAVDLRAPGKKKNKKYPIDIKYIIPRNKLVSFLVFDNEKCKEAITYGYLDTLKAYKIIEGDKYSFKKTNLWNNYKKYNEEIKKVLNNIIDNKTITNVALNLIYKNEIKGINKIVEKTGEIFQLPQNKLYRIKQYNKYLITKLEEIESINIKDIISKNKQTQIKNTAYKQKIVKTFYNALLENNIKKLIPIMPIFTNEFLSAVYLYVIKR